MSARKKRVTIEGLRRRAERARREARVARAAAGMDERIDALLTDPKKNTLPIPDVAVPIVLSLAALIVGDGEESDAIRRCAELRFDRWFLETVLSQIDAAMEAKKIAKKEPPK